MEVPDQLFKPEFDKKVKKIKKTQYSLWLPKKKIEHDEKRHVDAWDRAFQCFGETVYGLDECARQILSMRAYWFLRYLNSTGLVLPKAIMEMFIYAHKMYEDPEERLKLYVHSSEWDTRKDHIEWRCRTSIEQYIFYLGKSMMLHHPQVPYLNHHPFLPHHESLALDMRRDACLFFASASQIALSMLKSHDDSGAAYLDNYAKQSLTDYQMVSYDAYADYTRKKKVEDEEMRLRLEEKHEMEMIYESQQEEEKRKIRMDQAEKDYYAQVAEMRERHRRGFQTQEIELPLHMQRVAGRKTINVVHDLPKSAPISFVKPESLPTHAQDLPDPEDINRTSDFELAISIQNMRGSATAQEAEDENESNNEGEMKEEDVKKEEEDEDEEENKKRVPIEAEVIPEYSKLPERIVKEKLRVSTKSENTASIAAWSSATSDLSKSYKRDKVPRLPVWPYPVQHLPPVPPSSIRTDLFMEGQALGMTMLEARDYSDAFPFDLDYEVPEKVKNPLKLPKDPRPPSMVVDRCLDNHMRELGGLLTGWVDIMAFKSPALLLKMNRLRCSINMAYERVVLDPYSNSFYHLLQFISDVYESANHVNLLESMETILHCFPSLSGVLLKFIQMFEASHSGDVRLYQWETDLEATYKALFPYQSIDPLEMRHGIQDALACGNRPEFLEGILREANLKFKTAHLKAFPSVPFVEKTRDELLQAVLPTPWSEGNYGTGSREEIDEAHDHAVALEAALRLRRNLLQQEDTQKPNLKRPLHYSEGPQETCDEGLEEAIVKKSVCLREGGGSLAGLLGSDSDSDDE